MDGIPERGGIYSVKLIRKAKGRGSPETLSHKAARLLALSAASRAKE